MSQSFVAHPRKDAGGKIEIQRRGRPKLLADPEKEHCVTLIAEGGLGTACATTKQL